MNPCFLRDCSATGTHHITPGRYMCCSHFEEYVLNRGPRWQDTADVKQATFTAAAGKPMELNVTYVKPPWPQATLTQSDGEVIDLSGGTELLLPPG